MINSTFCNFKNTPGKHSYFNYLLENEDMTDSSPEVSIVTPFFNSDAIIFETANCILNQSFQNFEWLIVNDGSNNPASLEILNKLEKTDSRITIINKEFNSGPSDTRNKGIFAARGNYLFFIDADDLIELNAIEKYYIVLKSNEQYDMVNSWSVGFQDQEYFWQGNFFEVDKFIEENRVTTCFMAKKSLFQDILFDTTLNKGLEDWDFWLNALCNNKKGYTIPEYLFWYRRTNHALKWEHWDNGKKQQKLHSFLKAKYSEALKLIPNSNSDLNSYYKLDTTTLRTLKNVNPLQKNKKRILLILPWLELGGADKFNLDLISGLTKRWEITILTTTKNIQSWEPMFGKITPDIFHVPHLASTLKYQEIIFYLIDSRNPDIIFLSNSMYGYWSLPFLKTSYPSIPILDYIHCEDPGWMNGGYPRMNILMNSFLDKTVVTSNQLKKWILDQGGKNEAKIETCYINIDVEEVKKNTANRNKIREGWSIPEDFTIIVFAGRITAQKQPKVLINSLKQLSEKTPDFLTIILGDGPDYEEMRKDIFDFGLENQIWCMGSVTNEEVKRYMDASDIFFLPSLYEGIALSIYEAMAKELVIVGAAVGGQKELVSSDCGYLIDPSSPEQESTEYAKILHSLIENKEGLKKMKLNSRRRVEKLFRIEDMINKMESLFNKTITESKNKPEPTDLEKNIPNKYLLLLNQYFQQEKITDELWKELQYTRRILNEPNTINENTALAGEMEYLSKVNELTEWYNKEYEILPLWYKRVGHLIKVITGHRSLKSLYKRKE